MKTELDLCQEHAEHLGNLFRRWRMTVPDPYGPVPRDPALDHDEGAINVLSFVLHDLQQTVNHDVGRALKYIVGQLSKINARRALPDYDDFGKRAWHEDDMEEQRFQALRRLIEPLVVASSPIVDERAERQARIKRAAVV